MSADAPAVVQVDGLLGPAQVADALSVSKHYLWRLRNDGKFPQPDANLPGRSGAMPRWRASTVQRWIDEQAGRRG